MTNLNTGVKTKIFALFDTGSDREFLAGTAARQIDLKTHTKLTEVTTLRGPEVKETQMANFRIESLDGTYVCDVNDAIVDNLPVVDADIPPSRRDLSGYSHLDGVVFDDADGNVDLVLGAAHAAAFWGGEVRLGSKKLHEPMAINSKFGWTLLGQGGKKGGNSAICNWLKVDDASLQEVVSKAFNEDFIPHDDFEDLSKMQRDASSQLKRGVHFDNVKKQYSAPIPFKGGREAAMEKINAADSRSMAYRRLASLKRNLERFPIKKELVFKEMEKFIEEGAVEQIVDDYDAAKSDSPVWLLPIHIVSKPDQPDKIRFCMDARACANGTCLNHHVIGEVEHLVPLQQPCRDFRDPLYACTFDIRGFFHRVLVNVPDREVFRFFFFGDRSMTTTQLFRWSAHIFGAASSPTVTAYVLRHHADQIADMFDEYVVNTIRRRFYVDDGSGGKNTPEEYRKYVEDMQSAMALGGFELTKWKFSHPTLVGEPPVKQGEELVKFLGLRWNLMTDSLGIAVDDFQFPEAKTPRHFVKIGARIFDLEGWFIPYIVTGRGIIQKSMKPKEWGWDKLAAVEVQNEFRDWAGGIKHLAQYYIPRCWNTPETIGCIPDLHIFCDASETAYGAVAYRVVKGRNGIIESHIITSKGHVVPTNPKRASHNGTIPRLELVAAVKACDIRKNVEKLANKVVPTTPNGTVPRLEIKAAVKACDIRKNVEQLANKASEMTGEKFGRTVIWCDSTAVLEQIFDESSPPKGFVGNRVVRIQDATVADEWNYVPSTLNPADYITRGIRADEAKKWAIYHRGPDFLRGPESGWPEMIVNRHPNPPDPIVMFATSSGEAPTPSSAALLEMAESRSDWYDKTFRIASAIRARQAWRRTIELKKEKAVEKGERVLPPINAADVSAAEKLLVSAIQEAAFSKEKDQMRQWEIDSPTARNEVVRRSSIYPLNPFLDADGIIRVGSRLIHANIDEQQKFPAILPKNNKSVDALILRTHKELLHAGPNHVLSNLRQKYWIINGLQAIKRVLKFCPKCQRANKMPQEQKMAPLPPSRVVSTHAFDTTGVDIMGPFKVRKSGSRARHKLYVAVFTCFTTRSVHAETVDNMTADSFLMALDRFMARRPGLRHLWSDNGSNFKGSRTLLLKETQEWEEGAAPASHRTSKKDIQALKDQVQPRIISRGLDWTFLPPYASHYAGVWERVIGLFKRHLTKCVSGDVLHEEVFKTIIVQLEGILNDRPLTQPPTSAADISGLRPLRPRHLLCASFLEDRKLDWLTAEPLSGEASTSLFFLEARERVRAFWAAWKEDYLQLLMNRHKWQGTERNFKKDDLCLIVDKHHKRSTWKMARVVEVDNEDGHARKIFVRPADGKIQVLDRTKLVLLELDGGD